MNLFVFFFVISQHTPIESVGTLPESNDLFIHFLISIDESYTVEIS